MEMQPEKQPMTFAEYRAMLRAAKVDVEDETCPVRRALDLFSGKWNLKVLYELSKEDSLRFGALKRRLGGITGTTLSNTLKEMEARGFVRRQQFNEIPPHTEYSLTEAGQDLYTVFLALAAWSQKHFG